MKTVSSGIPGLDEVLGGGFIKPSVVLVAGPAGSGKTTFVVESLFNAVREHGERGLFMPTISEPVAMVNNYMAQYAFYDQEMFDRNLIEFMDLSRIIDGDWRAVVEKIREALEKFSPTWVVIDPLTVLGYGLPDMELRIFLNELFSTIKGWDALVLATGEFTRQHLFESPYSYMVDGIIFLNMDTSRHPVTREMEVVKLRGKNAIAGKHFFKIGPEGIRVYPKVVPTRPRVLSTPAAERVSTGIKGYDEMLGGGYLAGSTNLIIGGPGTGKTLFALSFIADGCRKNERGVFVTFEEPPTKLLREAKNIGIPLSEWIEKGMVTLLYYPPGDTHPEEVTWGIKNAVEVGETTRRVVVDSLSGFGSMVGDERKMNLYLSNMDAFLSGSGVTSVFTMGHAGVGGDYSDALQYAVVMDSITLLRYVEVESTISKSLAVLMMKGSEHQTDIREYTVGPGGVEVLERFKGFEGLLSGAARRSDLVDFTRILLEALPEKQRHLLSEMRWHYHEDGEDGGGGEEKEGGGE